MRFIISALITFCMLTFFANKSFAQKKETFYLDPKDSTLNKYVIIYPDKTPWTGFLFLIPSFGETPEHVFIQTDLPEVAAEKGLLTIIPTFKTGLQSFGIDSLTQLSFREILKDVLDRNKLTHQRFYIGGFSIGGSCVVKFAALAIKEDYALKPTAIFAIDPPLDFERFYYAAKRNVRLSVNSTPSQESIYFIDRIEKEMGGTPETALQHFYNLSPYSLSDTTQTAVKYLIKTPLRFYTEPDINWWLKERGNDYTNMNILDEAAMINELNRLGNDKARLIVSGNKGYRKPANMRHPHSWNIAESADLINWLLEQQ